MIRRLALAAFLVAVTLPAIAMASSLYGQMMMQRWSASDRCNATVQKAYPDYTAEGRAKRDALLKQCLTGQNLPPRGSLDTPTKP
jgi:hypothetical protein